MKVTKTINEVTVKFMYLVNEDGETKAYEDEVKYQGKFSQAKTKELIREKTKADRFMIISNHTEKVNYQVSLEDFLLVAVKVQNTDKGEQE